MQKGSFDVWCPRFITLIVVALTSNASIEKPRINIRFFYHVQGGWTFLLSNVSILSNGLPKHVSCLSLVHLCVRQQAESIVTSLLVVIRLACTPLSKPVPVFGPKYAKEL
jgi:hypothetical protein